MSRVGWASRPPCSASRGTLSNVFVRNHVERRSPGAARDAQHGGRDAHPTRCMQLCFSMRRVGSLLKFVLRSGVINPRELEQDRLEFAVVVLLFHLALPLAKRGEFTLQRVPFGALLRRQRPLLRAPHEMNLRRTQSI